MTASDGPIPARIFLRPVGTPLTIGMSGLAIASFVVSGLELGWIARTQSLDVGLILVSVPFILQLIACLFSYLARDGAAGAALGVLATTWLALGLVHVVSPPGQLSGALGLMLLACAGLLGLSAVAVANGKPLPAAVFCVAAVRFTLVAVYQLSGVPAWQRASGIVGLVIVGLAGYCVLAFELESQARPTVLPTLRREPGRAAVSDGGRSQLAGVAHEPGVRRAG